MALLPALILTTLGVGASWLLIAALIAGVRDRQGWLAGRIALVAGAALLLAILVPRPAVMILAAEGLAWVLSGMLSDTLAWARTPGYATPRDLLLFRRPAAQGDTAPTPASSDPYPERMPPVPLPRP